MSGWQNGRAQSRAPAVAHEILEVPDPDLRRRVLEVLLAPPQRPGLL